MNVIASSQLIEFLKLVWAQKLHNTPSLTTREGLPVEVIHPGQINLQEGPDILGASIKVGGVTCNGPIAIHTRSSQWREHLHHIDTQYDPCILHVVLEDDTSVCRINGETIPSITITYPPELGAIYEHLTATEQRSDRCGEVLSSMASVKGYHLLTRLMIERLERKHSDFLQIYKQSGNNWSEVFHIMLFRTMGAGKNKEAYTRLAQKVSYSDICRVKESVVAVEGLLLGAAGLLDTEMSGRFPDPYTIQLQQEADHLCRRFSIRPMQPREWDTAKSNPNNHPVVRIVELAGLLCSKEFLFSRLLECTEPAEIRKILTAEASEYWNTHYIPSQRSEFGVKRIGTMMQDILCINLVVPMFFTYGRISNNEALQERALEILEQLAPEINHYIRQWQRQGVVAENAFFSQALLQLSTEYCEKKRCAICNIGRSLLCSQEKTVPL